MHPEKGPQIVHLPTPQPHCGLQRACIGYTSLQGLCDSGVTMPDTTFYVTMFDQFLPFGHAAQRMIETRFRVMVQNFTDEGHIRYMVATVSSYEQQLGRDGSRVLDMELHTFHVRRAVSALRLVREWLHQHDFVRQEQGTIAMPRDLALCEGMFDFIKLNEDGDEYVWDEDALDDEDPLERIGR